MIKFLPKADAKGVSRQKVPQNSDSRELMIESEPPKVVVVGTSDKTTQTLN